jgi:hypothetical protein
LPCREPNLESPTSHKLNKQFLKSHLASCIFRHRRFKPQMLRYLSHVHQLRPLHQNISPDHVPTFFLTKQRCILIAVCLIVSLITAPGCHGILQLMQAFPWINP